MTRIVSRKGRALRRALFVCRDNFSASRFCEEYFNSLVRDEGLNWQASSRAALKPHELPLARKEMSERAVRALREQRAAPVSHRRAPASLTWRDVALADVLIAIDTSEADLERATGRWLLSLPVTHWTLRSAASPTGSFDELSRQVRQLVATLEGGCAAPIGRVSPDFGASTATRQPQASSQG